MENRPAPLRSRRVCRFCLTDSEPLSFIYERDHNKPFQVPLALQIMSCVAIEVYAADGMPQMICTMCRWNLDRSYKFKLQCKKADEALRDYPLSGVLPRPFPPIPNDPPTEIGSKRPAESRSQNEISKKQRTSDNDSRDARRETRERERERERERQNEKQNADEEHLYEEEQDGGSEGEQEVSNIKEERKLEPGEIRVHACDQCERTFPLRQALMLHIQRAHRDRNYKCTECDRHFFTKYDLSKHMSTHSEEKPYTCSICQKQFSRLTQLQRHEKVHREETRYACPHCDREFFTTEELEKHEDSAHKKEKPFQCNICNKRFQYKQGLERHEMLHNEDKTFVCDYCKEAFHTSTKLARHLSTHAGHRPYMCKLCPRTFLLSHHLTRHMRTHSVEKRHVCEDCGKAFKRKESLEVHQLTHTKRTGMGLTCDVCQESCRNRADYVTHIKQHIEAGEKMGPDGLQPDNKKNVELDSDEEEEEEDQYSDGDDDYEPPAYIVKKLPKPPKPSESEEEEEEDEEDREDKEEKSEKQEKEERKVVFVRGKDGNMVKKTIKTLMPIQRRDVQEQKVTKQTSSQSSSKGLTSSQKEDSPKSSHVDDTEAQVQKIVASVFKEHKIPLKHQSNVDQESKESVTPTIRSQITSQESRKDNDNTETPASAPKTIKVIKRIVTRKPAGSNEGSTPVPSTPSTKDGDSSLSGTPGTHKIRRVIVRRIIRQGDTTREVIMNPDGTTIDPAELAKLPAGNVVKRVVTKLPLDKSQNLIQAVLQSAKQRQKTDVIPNEKFELKTSASSSSGTPKSSAASQKPQLITQGQDQETKEKLEQLEKRVEQQRLKIEELQAKKAQQDYETIDEIPERHDESEDEQQLPLKRVFVKRKQSIYDEEREYNDDTETTKSSLIQAEKEEMEKVPLKKEESPTVEETLENVQKEIQSTVSGNNITTSSTTSIPKKGPTISSNKVYSNKRYMIVKPGDTSEVEEMSRELCSIFETTDNVVKIQETVLSNLTQISGIATSSTPGTSVKRKTDSAIVDEQLDQNSVINEEDIKQETAMEVEIAQETEIKLDPEVEEPAQIIAVQEESQPDSGTIALDTQDLSETASIFEASDDVLDIQKSASDNLNESVIELSQGNNTINLNDTNDSQDSLEDKLSQMEG
ncbi:hypothetical protein ALC56_04445 [Trachymyrmex septentrionalis]|uniref:Uncharacterized protein n=1 Tax=Trachymyrmex septentrionalis TaxID=34720 RepID=A0A195FN06_9HYME|nr:PREDICTED: uncharacterized protein LOC108747013 [Trachymyrmex septentrionalis]KYN41294.1 hypothetical protein ALC56_04445 [Trachymyrmex septentrionalis]